MKFIVYRRDPASNAPERLDIRTVAQANRAIRSFRNCRVLFGPACPRRLAVDASFVVVVAGVLEMLQLMTPDRRGHIADAFVKAAGEAFGVAMALTTLVKAGRYKAR